MTSGRLTKYNKQILVDARQYLIDFELEGDVIPSIEGLALYLGINRDTVYDWRNQDDKVIFSDIVSEILSKQAKILLNKGLSSEFNASITKLMLTKHGYSDKLETNLTADIAVKEFSDMYDCDS